MSPSHRTTSFVQDPHTHAHAHMHEVLVILY